MRSSILNQSAISNAVGPPPSILFSRRSADRPIPRRRAFWPHWPRITAMAGKTVNDWSGTAAIVRDFRDIVRIYCLHHREHQARGALLFLVVEIPFADDVAEPAAHAKRTAEAVVHDVDEPP